MRVMDGLMSIPPILLAVALMALTRGSVGDVIVAITIAEIPRVSRLVRSVVLVAARPTLCRYGGGGRHPYADDHPAAHLAEASADDRAGDLYLRQRHDRRGDPVFHRRWNAADYAIGQVKPFIVFFPAAFLSVTVLAVNLLGDRLRDALDPRTANGL